MIDVSYLIGNLDKEHGGAQQLLFDICRHLPEAEFDTTVYHMFGEGTYREQFERQGTSVVNLSASSNYDVFTLYQLIRKLRAASPDILHTNSPISGSWGRPAAKFSGVSKIMSVEHNVHTEYPAPAQIVNGLTLPLTDAIVGVSQVVSESYLAWEEMLLRDSIRRTTIRNGVDVKSIKESFDQSGEVLNKFTPLAPSELIIGTMGRLHKQKGYEYLIRAFPKIKHRHPNANLLVLGDGPEREKLQKIAKQTNYFEDIYFTGYVPEVYPFLPNFDVAVFPSLWEGFGLTPVESMIAECPVVATDIDAFREVIGDAGLLVEPEDEAAIATAVTNLLENPSKRSELGKRGYKRAVENFSIERTVEEYAELYRELANE